MAYYIYIVKATRKPYLVKEINPADNPHAEADKVCASYKLMYDAGMAVPGVSIQLITDEHIERVKNVTIGGFELHGIPVIYQCGGW